MMKAASGALALMLLQAAQRPAPPVQLFELTLQNQARPALHAAVTTPNVEVQRRRRQEHRRRHGNDRSCRVCSSGCARARGSALRDKTKLFDLRGRASLRVTTIVSGFHRVRR
jgi:hypothetical protein